MKLGEYELLKDYWVDLNDALRDRPKIPARDDFNCYQIKVAAGSGDLAIRAVFQGQSRLTSLRTSEDRGTGNNIATKLDFAEEYAQTDKRITGHLLVTGRSSMRVSGLLIVETEDIPPAEQMALDRGVELLLTAG